MTHLGDRAAALVDGQLTAEATERAAMHLVGCRPCRDAVELERLTKQRLASLRGPEPDDTFLAQLVAMAGPAGPLPPREERLEVAGAIPGATTGTTPGTMAGPVTVAGRSVGTRPAGRSSAWGRRPGDTRPAGSAPARRTATNRPRLAAAVLAASVMVGAGVTVGGVAAAGATATGKKVVPAMDSFVAQHSTSAVVLPFTDQSIVWGTAGSNR